MWRSSSPYFSKMFQNYSLWFSTATFPNWVRFARRLKIHIIFLPSVSITIYHFPTCSTNRCYYIFPTLCSLCGISDCCFSPWRLGVWILISPILTCKHFLITVLRQTDSTLNPSTLRRIPNMPKFAANLEKNYGAKIRALQNHLIYYWNEILFS